MSEARFQLGRHLFHDPRLSGNGTLSCASCHKQALAFTDGPAAWPWVQRARRTARSAQGLANVAWYATYTWANYSLVTLERQMEVPLYGIDPVEMGINDGNQAAILERFRRDPGYTRRFRQAFPGEIEPIRISNIIKAIAVFQRALVSFDSRYDRHLQGRQRLSADELRGRKLFFSERAQCANCHRGFNFRRPNAACRHP